MRVLSGIQPSGKLHLGNYLGMMRRMIRFQSEHELFCFIVNLHALTTVFDASQLRENTLEAAADFLSLGLDPGRAVFWVQSDVPEVLELTWYLSNITPFGLLERGTSYKDKVEKGLSASHGLFSYPVLMAADILLYQAQRVPVGKDQKQHLEMARDIAEKFNHTYGETFRVPEPDIEAYAALVPGLDGLKMSKSYGNTIEIFSDSATLKKQVMSIKTDSRGVAEPKDPESCTVYLLYRLLATTEQGEAMAAKLKSGGYGYGEAKKDLLLVLEETFAPYWEKKRKWMHDQSTLMDILEAGAGKARAIALPTLETVRSKVGVAYRGTAK